VSYLVEQFVLLRSIETKPYDSEICPLWMDTSSTGWQAKDPSVSSSLVTRLEGRHARVFFFWPLTLLFSVFLVALRLKSTSRQLSHPRSLSLIRVGEPWVFFLSLYLDIVESDIVTSEI
jgi:hypothetical protein